MSAALVVRLFFWAWFAAAVAAGQSLLLPRLPPIWPPLAMVGLAGGLLAVCRRVPALRDWVATLELRSLVLVQVTRCFGLYFLYLYQRGDLPRAFAVSGGMGGIAVATMALPVALAPMAELSRQRAILIWNVVGSIDLLMLILNTTALAVSQPAALRPFNHLPASLGPTLLVPLLAVSHALIFVRLAQGKRAA